MRTSVLSLLALVAYVTAAGQNSDDDEYPYPTFGNVTLRFKTSVGCHHYSLLQCPGTFNSLRARK